MDIDYPNMNGYYHVLSFCFKDEEFWITSSDEDEVSVKECSTTEPIWQIVFFLMLWQSLYRVSNTALNVLLKALAVFVRVIGTSFSGNKVESLSSNMPRDTKAAHKLLFHTGEDDFINYVVCPKCHSIYEYKDCIVLQHGRRESIECHHVSYPNHPQLSRRSMCGATLLKRTRDDKLVPIKTYCYQPLHKSLHNLVQKEGFLDACEHWRARSPHSPHLVDIYDGQVWHDLESSGFLGAPFCYALTLNVDWFQPFTHIQYSIGAIYLTVQNLPRTERYKAENMILVGIIPGPAEPPLTINSYLAPLVDDLKHAWSPGISISTRNCSSITVRLALTCVACEIPASRKVCGFVGHNARLGCNKCFKQFLVTSDGNVDYSGFDRETWPSRTVESHRERCLELMKQSTKTGMRKMESDLGVRHSCLLSLSYFNPVRFTVVDIMHNLFLGTGKHVFKLWVCLGLITKDVFTELERRMTRFCLPYSVGRLPINLSSNYGGFTALQWQLWITIYSAIVLKGLLPDAHYVCWLLYVRACSILSQRALKQSDINTADLLLLTFCKKFELLYGKEKCTPNMHLHLHLKDCLMDYGPSHAFWCFSFERYNGMLGAFHTNGKSIGSQIMRKFVSGQRLHSVKSALDQEFMTLLPERHQFSRTSSIRSEDQSTLNVLNMSLCPLNSIPSFNNNHAASLLPPFREDVFTSQLLKDLTSLYGKLYAHLSVSHHFISPFFLRSGRINFCGQLIGSEMNATSSCSSSVIMAYWPSKGDDLSTIDYGERMAVGTVQYFC